MFSLHFARDGRIGPSPDHPGRTDGQKELVKNNILLDYIVFYYFLQDFTDRLLKHIVLLVFCYVLPIKKPRKPIFACVWTWISVSRAFQPVPGRIFHVESEFEVKNKDFESEIRFLLVICYVWDLDFSFQSFPAGSREDFSHRIRI